MAQDKNEVLDLATKLATSFDVDAATFEKVYGRVLTDENMDLVVAAFDSRIVGYALAIHHYAFYANGLVSWVEEIMVEEDVRRQGIGRALMSEIETRARERGSALVAMATRRAEAFYTALGYEASATYFKKPLHIDDE